MVLNLITGCVSPQYHCCFDDFFKTTHHGGPDVSGTICWQQLAGLDRATAILLEVSTPTPHSVKYPETPSDLAADRPPAPIDPICNRHTPFPVMGTEGLLPHSSHTGRIVELDRRSGVVPST
jgi:hypothetical protein